MGKTAIAEEAGFESRGWRGPSDANGSGSPGMPGLGPADSGMDSLIDSATAFFMGLQALHGEQKTQSAGTATIFIQPIPFIIGCVGELDLASSGPFS